MPNVEHNKSEWNEFVLYPESLKHVIQKNQVVIEGKVESSKLKLIIVGGEFYRPNEKIPGITEEGRMIMARGIYSGKIRVNQVIKRGSDKTIVKDKILNVTWTEYIDPKTQEITRSMCPHIFYYTRPKSCVMALNYRQLGLSLSHDYPILTKTNFLKAKELLAKEDQLETQKKAEK